MEEWRDVIGYEGHYQVSSLGRVKSVSRSVVIKIAGRVDTVRPIKERVMWMGKEGNGYPVVQLTKDGVQVKYLVHRLVAKAFLEGPEKDTVNHIDFDKSNNRVENLEWATRSENQVHSVNHGRGAYGKKGWKVLDRLDAAKREIDKANWDLRVLGVSLVHQGKDGLRSIDPLSVEGKEILGKFGK